MPALLATDPGRSADAAEALHHVAHLVRAGDYFEMLGVAADAGPAEIQAGHAAQRSVIEWVAASGLPHDPELLDRLRAALDEALDVLRHPELRASYRRNLSALG